MCTLDGCGSQSSLPLPKVEDEKRRQFLAGLGSLPLASVLAYPELAAAQAARVQDAPLELSNGVKALGVLAMPETLPAPAVILIHEWWGLNDQIKAVAQELANEGYIAYAIDLYRGQVAESAQQARALMQSVDTGIAISQLGGVANFLKNHEACNGKVGTVGWCFGGGWSINAAMALDIDASVIFSGRVLNPLGN